MKAKSVTLADIARQLDISVNAVSVALRGKNGVSDDLRERIIKKAREMHYPGLNQPQSCILALIPQRFSLQLNNSFYQNVCFQMEAYAASLGYQLIISSVPEEAERALYIPTLLNTVSCCGIITIGNLSPNYCRMIQSQGLPYVMADQYYDNIAISSVVTANTSGAYLLTQHLIENGHTNIHFFEQAFRTGSLRDRWTGYQRAMHDHGLTPFIAPILLTPNVVAEEGDWVRESLDAMPDLPTAFVCGHDVTAQRLISVLSERGLRCPEDFSVVGFDNIQNPDVLSLRLTTYSTPKQGIAETAVDMLIDKDNKRPKCIHLYGEIIYRDSVRDIRPISQK